MTFEEFKSTIINASPPEGINNQLIALWYDAKGDWNKAHKVAQDINNPNGAWIHAYLHRKECDNSNASYWYSHAGKKFSNLTLEEEWEEIAKEMLKM